MSLTANQITQRARIKATEIKIITSNIKKLGVETDWGVINSLTDRVKRLFPGE